MFGLDNNVLLGLVGVVVVFCLLTNKKSFKSLMKGDMLVIVGLTIFLACCMAKGGRVVEGLCSGISESNDRECRALNNNENTCRENGRCEWNPHFTIQNFFNSLEYFDEGIHCRSPTHCTEEIIRALRGAGVTIKNELCENGLTDEVHGLLNGMLDADLFTDVAPHLKRHCENRGV